MLQGMLKALYTQSIYKRKMLGVLPVGSYGVLSVLRKTWFKKKIKL
jgi:hypothetical protein